ncbi:FRG domain-containing protein [Fimbriimonas ginsengisoli]|uniref:FRG domain-containing protein n=1 Tax=Fimbriimonas ginsengisoli TaxID=1005039 RepID=UPI00056FDE4B|nr:FRG domain-containing protein [Fimbriimonas ginsengisoli]
MYAESWSHLCGLLFEESWQEPLGRFRSHYAYKGLSSSEYMLTTTLMRLRGDFPAVERHLIRNFKKYAQRDVSTIDSLWNWVALAQHHGLPTRLLDWTYSPFVALHFATAGHDLGHHDSIVWAIDYVGAHELLPDRQRKALREEGSDVWTTELLDAHVPTWEALNGLGDGEDVLFFFEPPSLDQRIVNQYALFSVLSNPSRTIEEWAGVHPHLAKRIVIPKELCWEVRDKLDQANINERVLFPGLDGLSMWLRRHYRQVDR